MSDDFVPLLKRVDKDNINPYFNKIYEKDVLECLKKFKKRIGIPGIALNGTRQLEITKDKKEYYKGIIEERKRILKIFNDVFGEVEE